MGWAAAWAGGGLMAKLNQNQRDAVKKAHKALDRLAVVPPGYPDTAEAREARELRTQMEANFPDAFEQPKPDIEIAKK